jgi:hypothetical protein
MDLLANQKKSQKPNDTDIFPVRRTSPQKSGTKNSLFDSINKITTYKEYKAVEFKR